MAQERCVRRCPAHGRLWEIGEVRTITAYDDSGKPVVSDHFRLVEDDESVKETEVYSDEEVKEKRREVGMRDQEAGIRRACEQLDPDKDEHWTSKGDPSLQALHTLCDFELSRAVVRAAWPEFDRELARGGFEDKRRAS